MARARVSCDGLPLSLLAPDTIDHDIRDTLHDVEAQLHAVLRTGYARRPFLSLFGAFCALSHAWNALLFSSRLLQSRLRRQLIIIFVDPPLASLAL